MMSKREALHKAERHVSKLVEMVEQATVEGWRVDEFERVSFEELLELGFELLTAFVAARGDGDEGAEVERGEKTLKRLEERRRRRYVSIYGPLELERRVYGTREGQRIEYVPLDAALGLPAGEISYVLEDWLERMCVQNAFRESVNSLVELLGVRANVSVETAEKHAREMAQHAASFRTSLTPPPSEEEGELLVAAFDNKGVPMRRLADPESAPRDHHRRRKGEKANKKQMACVGASYSINRFRRTADDVLDELLRKERVQDRPRPQHKHVWAEMTRPSEDPLEDSLLHGPTHMFVELAVECYLRDPEKEKILICLIDGEKQLWNLQAEWLPRSIGILDVFHVTEWLWKAAYCFHAEQSPQAKQFVEHYLRMLLEGQVDSVVRSFRKLLSTRGLRGEKARRLQAVITYYANNREHMRYDEYLAAGYPIGSGVAEGACRHLVKDRLELTGMRWTVSGAQATLHLRSLYLNGDWKSFVDHRIKEEQTALYAQAA